MTVCHSSKLLQNSVNRASSSGASWPINSGGGQKEKFSDKIYLICFNQIETFHVSVRVQVAEKLITFVFVANMYCKCTFILSLSLHTYCECF